MAPVPGRHGRQCSSTPSDGSPVGTVRCIHGANEQNLPIAGLTIAWVRTNLRHALNLGYYSAAFINGQSTDHDHVLNAGDDVEFVRRFGFNAAGATPCEVLKARGLIATYPELVKIGKVVKALRLGADEAVEVTLTLVAQFFERKFGPVPDHELPSLIELTRRIACLEGKIEGKSDTPHPPEGHHADDQPRSIKQASKADTRSGRTIARGDPSSMTVREFAARVDISLSLAYQLIAEGRVPHRRIGQRGKRGCIRITEGDYRTFLESTKALETK